MIYIILDLDTANQVGTFASQAAALADVRDAVERFGRPYAASWGLASKDADGTMATLAEGEALVGRAFEQATPVTDRT